MLELRVVTADDWALWRALRLAALAEAPEAFGSTLAEWSGEGDREQRWRARLSIPGAHELVVHLDGAPVGMVSGVPTADAGVVEMISMWVSPAGRGRGVGDRLVEAVVQWARERGATTLRLAVMRDNAPAIALYERHGFAAVAAEAGGGDVRERVMEKRLDA